MCMLIGSQQRIGGKTVYLSGNGSVFMQVSPIKYLGLVEKQFYKKWNLRIEITEKVKKQESNKPAY